jgi:hypothetical protein
MLDLARSVEGLVGWIRRNLLVPVPRAASEPSGSNRAIRPEPDLADAEISGSADGQCPDPASYKLLTIAK